MFTSTVYVTLNYFRFSSEIQRGKEKRSLGEHQTFGIDPGHGSKKARGQFRTKSPEAREKKDASQDFENGRGHFFANSI